MENNCPRGDFRGENYEKGNQKLSTFPKLGEGLGDFDFAKISL